MLSLLCQWTVVRGQELLFERRKVLNFLVTPSEGSCIS